MQRRFCGIESGANAESVLRNFIMHFYLKRPETVLAHIEVPLHGFPFN